MRYQRNYSMISQRLLGQAEYRHYRRSYLLSVLAESGRGLVYVLRTVLGIRTFQPQGNNWASIGVLGLDVAPFMGGTPATAKANGSDDPISECVRCWSRLFARPQERLRT
jgi:hypothetical protein